MDALVVFVFGRPELQILIWKLGFEEKLEGETLSGFKEDNIHPPAQLCLSWELVCFPLVGDKMSLEIYRWETKANLCEWKACPGFSLVTKSETRGGVSRSAEGRWEAQRSKFTGPWSPGHWGGGGGIGCGLSLGEHQEHLGYMLGVRRPCGVWGREGVTTKLTDILEKTHFIRNPTWFVPTKWAGILHRHTEVKLPCE